jgi:glycosyltransferase involved in cell wall biosynthesis
MNKKRILMCAEYHGVNSGFGRYTKEILTALHKRPDFEIAEFASYRKEGLPNNDVPWRVYANEPLDGTPEKEAYKNNPINQFGQWRFEKTVLHFKPDIVFDIRDYWMFAYQETSPLRKYYHWVVAPTIDSIPQKPEWLKTYENADVVLTHTDWAENYLKQQNRPINIQGCVTDSVDPTIFKPVGHTKSYHKMKYGLPSDAIVIGSVMRNQKRKLIPELFRSLQQLLNDVGRSQKIFLYLHTSFPETHGWNIPELLQEFGVSNNVLFTYYSPHKKDIIISPYKGPKIVHTDGSRDAFYVFPNVIHGVSNKQLSDIYNCFDIYVQYAICEGLGIPQLEAASCGIPIFSVNYSGMEEITNKVNGIKINNRLCKELETGAERAIPDNNHLISEIKKWMSLDKKDKSALSKKTRELLVENYSWEKTANKMIEIFDSLPPKNIWDQPMTTNATAKVPDGLSNRDFVYWIVNNIIQSPELIKTSLIQNIIKNMDEGYASTDGGIGNFDHKASVQVLETYLNNKIFCEKIRNNEIEMKDNFLNR